MGKTLNRVLITGATGKIGGQVIAKLESRVAIRAFCRNAASANLPESIEIAQGDLTDVGDFEKALQDIDTVFLIWPLLPVDKAKPLIDAIAHRGKSLVYLSSANAGDPVDRVSNPISGAHYEVEQLIEARVLEWTMIRPTAFASNTLMFWSDQIRNTGRVQWPLPSARLSVIHDGDIAAVIAQVITSGSYSRQKLLLTGPAVLTPIEELEEIGRAIGRTLIFEEMTVAAARTQMFNWGLPESIADGVLGYWARKVDNPEPLTDTVEQVTGRKARSFQAWAAENAPKFN
jgi:uncharacterized protein YbjT (DUF2867 family)